MGCHKVPCKLNLFKNQFGGRNKIPKHFCSPKDFTGFPNQLEQSKLGLNFAPHRLIVHLLSLNKNILFRHIHYICDSLMYYSVNF